MADYDITRRALAGTYGDADAEDALGNALLSLVERGVSINNPSGFIIKSARDNCKAEVRRAQRERAAWQQRFLLDHDGSERLPEMEQATTEAHLDASKRYYQKLKKDPEKYKRRLARAAERKRGYRARDKLKSAS